MKLFAIGDLHLSLGDKVDKPMEIFGGQWVNHADRVREHFLSMVSPEDWVILCGDLSWALKAEDAMADLNWIKDLPGRKLLFKGNHDLWWQSTAKLNKAFEGENMFFLQNQALMLDFPDKRVAVAGTRGWTCPGDADFAAHDRKIYNREVLRLKMSLEAAKSMEPDEIVGVLHFPPTNDKKQGSDFTELMAEYGVKTCVYGHLHGRDAFGKGLQSTLNGVNYKLVSLDFLETCPLQII